MRVVTIQGTDFETLRRVLTQALDGEFGPINSMTVSDGIQNGLRFTFNWYTSRSLGHNKILEGSGNPYANIQDEDMSLNERVLLLERDVRWLTKQLALHEIS